MINVKVIEGLFEMFSCEVKGIQSCNNKLGEINLPRTISVDYPHQELYAIWRKLLFR